MVDEATVFVPGHVTGFFSIHRDDDPTKAGSRGAGVTLSDGIRVTVCESDETVLRLDGTAVQMSPVTRVLDALSARAEVDVESDVPIGAGFGVSGAASLGTALAVNAVFDRHLSENELTAIAHGAEVQAGTGLGDVVGQARGGAPIRLEPGAPPHGLLDGIPDQRRIEYVTFGELSTEQVLTGDTDRITEAGRRALSVVVAEPTLPQFMYASRRFAREAGLLTQRVRSAIQDVSEEGGDAAMAMLGETVFALGTGLTDAGYNARVCRIHPTGSTFESTR
ncbi:MAG: pantoate kinase [Halobacteriota archaeon]